MLSAQLSANQVCYICPSLWLNSSSSNHTNFCLFGRPGPLRAVGVRRRAPQGHTVGSPPRRLLELDMCNEGDDTRSVGSGVRTANLQITGLALLPTDPKRYLRALMLSAQLSANRVCYIIIMGIMFCNIGCFTGVDPGFYQGGATIDINPVTTFF